MKQEIEARFLEIDKNALVEKLRMLGALDQGEHVLEEVIFYDPALRWRDVERRFLRLRKKAGAVELTYKHNSEERIDSAREIEFGVEDFLKTRDFFETIGFVPYRFQQKKRNTFRYGNVIVDIVTWPRVTAYVE